MQIIGDCDLNSMQRYTHSLQETIKETMLKQEFIFREQVRELHRLYTVQKSLMKEFGWKDFKPHDLGRASMLQSLGSFTKRIKYEPLVTDETFSPVPLAYSTWYTDGGLLQGHKSVFSGVRQRHLDLQCPLGDYFNQVGRDVGKEGHGWNFLEKPVELKTAFCSDHTCSLTEVKLSLSIGDNSEKKSDGRRTWNSKINCYPSQHIIDLEKPLETLHDEDATPASALCHPQIAASGDEHKMQGSGQSCGNHTNYFPEGQSHWIGMAYSHEHVSQSFRGHNSNQGFDKRNCDLPCNHLSNKGKSFPSYVAVDLDLNRAQLDELDESSFHSNKSDLCTGGSLGASVGPTDRFHTVGGRNPNRTSAFFQEAIVSPTLLDSKSNNNVVNVGGRSASFMSICGTKACPIGLESVSGPTSDLTEDPATLSRDSEHKNAELQVRLKNNKHTDDAVPEINSEEKENILVLDQHRNQDIVGVLHSGQSLVSCKFECIDDDNASSIKLPGTDLEESNTTPLDIVQNSGSSQVACTSCKQDNLSSASSQLKHQCCDKKKELAELDVLTQKAALSLICISLGIPFSSQDYDTKTGSNDRGNEPREQPQYSSDSYEALVLKLPESSAEDYCVTSKAYEISETDKKDNGIKLRRGRRLKDFQKEILPGLASLSRHEICEDINIMEGVIRSREYKKLKSKMVNGENWFTPVRSRRSRLTYVGRRYY